MDYEQWGTEYLEEAEKLKEQETKLRQKFSNLTGEDQILLFRRLSMLRAMHLECLHTGRYLLERGKAGETTRKTELGTSGEYTGSPVRTGT